MVESTAYNDRTWLGDGYPHSENLRVREGWRRSDFGHLTMDMELSDPAIYQRVWTLAVSGTYSADTDLLEYVYAENEKDRTHLVGKNSDDAKGSGATGTDYSPQSRRAGCEANSPARRRDSQSR